MPTTTGSPADITVPHWIGGKEVPGSGPASAVTDPATGVVTGHVGLATAAELDDAVAAGAEAFPAWRATSLARRAEVLFGFRERVAAGRDQLAAIITAEHGKVTGDALGEVARGLEVVEWACGIGAHLRGAHAAGVSTGVDVHSLRQPLGPVAVVGPFNFPAMVPMWFFPVAIACGNTVVVKPSEKVPSAMVWLARRFAEAGLPDGVLNVLHGDAGAVDGLCAHPGIRAVSFVGSTPVAEHVHAAATATGKRVQALGGAKNHMVVLPDADLDAAADAAVSAGYGSAGERCMAVSVVVAVGDRADDLVARIADRSRALHVGDGRRGCDMGPLVSAAARDRVRGVIDAAAGEGAEVVVDGRPVVPDADGDGFWVGPTLLDRVRPGTAAYDVEIFGPVLSVVRVGTYAEAVELVNANPYGNGVAVFTADGGAARRFAEEVEVGMVGVNVPIPVPVATFPFGGWGRSLFGDLHAYGPDGVAFYTRGKVVTTRWPDPGHGGIDLGFPANR